VRGSMLVGICSVALFATLGSSAASASNVIVFSHDNSASTNNLIQQLMIFGETVTTVSSELPVDLSGYDAIWHFASGALSLTNADRLADFVATGGGVFLSGRGDDGAGQNDSLELLLNSIVLGGGLDLYGSEFFPPTHPNSGAIAGVTQGLGFFATHGDFGEISGISDASNVFSRCGATLTIPCGGVWDSEDLMGNGRLVILMSTRWNYPVPATAVVENLEEFLVPEPSGPLLLACGIAGLTAAERRRSQRR
jgi:hypothetical protein